MKRLLFFYFLAVFSLPAMLRAQAEVLNEAERQRLLQLTTEEQRIDTLNEWAHLSRGEQSRNYALQALRLAENAGYPKGRGDSFVRLAKLAKDYDGNDEAAIVHLEKALAIRTALNDFPGVAACYVYLGQIQKDNGRFDQSADLFQRGLKIMAGQPPHLNTGMLYSNLGAVCRRRGQVEMALQYFRESVAVYAHLTPQTDGGRRDIRSALASVRMNLAVVLQEDLGQYEAARDSLEKSLADFQVLGAARNTGKCQLLLGNNAYWSGQLKEALKWYDQALAGGGLSKDDRAIVSKNRGRVYLDQRKYEAALRDLQASLDSFIAVGNTREIAATRFEIGNYYFEREQPAKAVRSYQTALDSNLQDPLLKARLLYFLSYALEQTGRPEEAARYTEQYVQTLDQLDTPQTRGAFQALVRYQLEKDRLHKRLLIEEKNALRLKTLVGAMLLSLLALLAISIALFNRQKRRAAERKEEIARKNEEIAYKNEQLALRENLDLLRRKELEINYARLAGQDETQKRIGQELHDGVGALLSTVKINLAPVDEVLDRLPAEKRAQYAAANRLLDEACEELRRISHELASAVLQKFGLKAQLEALADVVRRSGKLRVELATHGLRERLDYHTELNIYRIVQELFQNVVKHARAQNITIQVNRFDDRINVIVEDDGQGFDPAKVRQKPGLGLQGLTARVHELRGEIQIDSRPGRGSNICIDFPLK